jgi:hypothetical protein
LSNSCILSVVTCAVFVNDVWVLAVSAAEQGAGIWAGLADRTAEQVDHLGEGADEVGEGVGAGGFAQVVLGRGGDVGLGAVEVEVVQDGVDAGEQEHDVAGVPGVEGEPGELVVAAGCSRPFKMSMKVTFRVAMCQAWGTPPGWVPGGVSVARVSWWWSVCRGFLGDGGARAASSLKSVSDRPACSRCRRM